MPVNHYWHPQTDEFRKMGVPVPVAKAHGTEEQIREKLKPQIPNSWELQGNTLIGQTEYGRVVQTIPSDYILTGTDEKGLPLLKRIDVS